MNSEEWGFLQDSITDGSHQFNCATVPTGDFYQRGNVHLLENAWLAMVKKGLEAS